MDVHYTVYMIVQVRSSLVELIFNEVLLGSLQMILDAFSMMGGVTMTRCSTTLSSLVGLCVLYLRL